MTGKAAAEEEMEVGLDVSRLFWLFSRPRIFIQHDQLAIVQRR